MEEAYNQMKQENRLLKEQIDRERTGKAKETRNKTLQELIRDENEQEQKKTYAKSVAVSPMRRPPK